jgi:hypothetical protein
MSLICYSSAYFCISAVFIMGMTDKEIPIIAGTTYVDEAKKFMNSYISVPYILSSLAIFMSWFL